MSALYLDPAAFMTNLVVFSYESNWDIKKIMNFELEFEKIF